MAVQYWHGCDVLRIKGSSIDAGSTRRNSRYIFKKIGAECSWKNKIMVECGVKNDLSYHSIYYTNIEYGILKIRFTCERCIFSLLFS